MNFIHKQAEGRVWPTGWNLLTLALGSRKGIEGAIHRTIDEVRIGLKPQGSGFALERKFLHLFGHLLHLTSSLCVCLVLLNCEHLRARNVF